MQARRDLQRFYLTPSVGIFTCALATLIAVVFLRERLGLSHLLPEGFMSPCCVISAALIAATISLAARLSNWIDVAWIAAILTPVPLVPPLRRIPPAASTRAPVRRGKNRKLALILPLSRRRLRRHRVPWAAANGWAEPHVGLRVARSSARSLATRVKVLPLAPLPSPGTECNGGIQSGLFRLYERPLIYAPLSAVFSWSMVSRGRAAAEMLVPIACGGEWPCTSRPTRVRTTACMADL
ncbi:hypothetical protein SAMN05445504_9577 [Burkholderia sp. CF099]|nr:hypothetical protein SAMN05445504_9577 [Burkholderia sp. CF099]